MEDNAVKTKSFNFALSVIKLYQELVEQREYVISKQFLRSGTSIGANVEEALAGQSRRDFLSKMSIASKEARETLYWLRLLKESNLTTVSVNNAIADADGLVRLLTSIVKTTGDSMNGIQNSKSKIQN